MKYQDDSCVISPDLLGRLQGRLSWEEIKYHAYKFLEKRYYEDLKVGLVLSTQKTTQTNKKLRRVSSPEKDKKLCRKGKEIIIFCVAQLLYMVFTQL